MKTYSHISILKFNAVKENLPEFVKHQWKGRVFSGFNSGVVLETEKYKYDLRYACLEILNCETWTPNQIGTGEIAKRVLKCFKHKEISLINYSCALR
jgi:hypothetical protein